MNVFIIHLYFEFKCLFDCEINLKWGKQWKSKKGEERKWNKM